MEFKRILEAYEEALNELCSSIDYSKAALDMKTNNAAFSKMFHEMSIDELKHSGYLKSMIEKTIDSMIHDNKMIDEFNIIFEYKNDKYYDKLSKAKVMIQYYEGKT